MTLEKDLLFIAVIVYCAASPTVEGFSQDNQQCSTRTDCGDGQCCITQPIRYGKTHCSPLRQFGEPCVPHAKLMNSTQVYPDGTQRHFIDVFWIICPCAPPLICNWVSGLCGLEENDVDPDLTTQVTIGT